MYRYLSASEGGIARSISSLVGKEYPDIVAPIDVFWPHVSILARKSVFNFVARTGVAYPDRRSEALIQEVFEQLQPEAKDTAPVSVEGVDYFGTRLAIVVESPLVLTEIDYAHSALEKFIGRSIYGDVRVAHVSIGRLLTPPSPELSNQILDTAADICGTHLPEDLTLTLGKVSLIDPKTYAGSMMNGSELIA
jgi:hypothetical protein